MRISGTIGIKDWETKLYELSHPINRLGDIYKKVLHNTTNIQRINIVAEKDKNLNDKKLLQQIDLIKSLDIDYTVKCNTFSQVDILKEKGYNFYLDLVVTDWEKFHTLVNYGVSDIFIDGPLGFDIKHLAKKNVIIRTNPCFSYNTLNPHTETFFFIRPEDINLYENYIDIFEFNDTNILDIYLKQDYLFNIQDIVSQFPQPFNNKLFPNTWGKIRMGCGMTCMRELESCHFCTSATKIQKILMKYLGDK